MSRFSQTKMTTIQKASETCRIVSDRDVSEGAVSFLKSTISDERSFWNNYLVSDFAYAALDLLGVEKYKGARYEVLRLIESKLVFD